MTASDLAALKSLYGGMIDISGLRFGRLLVLKRAPNLSVHQTAWHCVCDCGKKRVVRSASLRCGETKSCGCLCADLSKARATKHGLFLSHPRAFQAWRNMMGRCYGASYRQSHIYKGRISVCKEWHSPTKFAEDMGEPKKGLQLDRINNDRDYEPGNCRWVSSAVQANNKRNTRYLVYRGERIAAGMLARRVGISYQLLQKRIGRGWTVEDAVLPARKKS